MRPLCILIGIVMMTYAFGMMLFVKDDLHRNRRSLLKPKPIPSLSFALAFPGPDTTYRDEPVD